jgi:hypothetical protein
MKRAIYFIIIVVSFTSVVTAQYKVRPNMPFLTFNSNPGFITINEFTGGIGLGGTTAPYSKSFFGFTSVNGYQVNKNFILGAGTGLCFYESGLLVPLFLDFRFTFNTGQLTPYLFADGGLLLNFSNFDGTKLFINPGVGARYTLIRNLAINLGAGILSQVDATVRESFVNLKLGAVYKF